MSSLDEELKAINDELAELEDQKQALIERKASLEKTRHSQNPSNTKKISAEERILNRTGKFGGGFV